MWKAIPNRDKAPHPTDFVEVRVRYLAPVRIDCIVDHDLVARLVPMDLPWASPVDAYAIYFGITPVGRLARATLWSTETAAE
ncbi:hypothetical protein [Aporhodopirellula aestuarii]|uniref:Uncharacterized protein n=1 Tax=Aporhodopirellula aestuarii TaxID=2950107 RepID=A0ABT0TYC6_9BACT|nr:hypothetical protein [Aporhodopirellula aestuarii]MCM2369589.1 hypothetical protein [Aporhodopirellula aestuarii]